MELNLCNGPLYAVSDLHLGDGGPRDNFASGNHEKDFWEFLSMVERKHGRLVICGDMFEFWQANISKVLTFRTDLLDKLAKLHTIYVIGNHDADLVYFIGKNWINHPFFKTACRSYGEIIGGMKVGFIHGHEADPYCADENPGIGRITAIYSGLKEDKNGGPIWDKYQTVENRSLSRMNWASKFWHKLGRKPCACLEMQKGMNRIRKNLNTDVLIFGHTHEAGSYGATFYNCGSWTERTNSFVRIDHTGEIKVFNWETGNAVPNFTSLEFCHVGNDA